LCSLRGNTTGKGLFLNGKEIIISLDSGWKGPGLEILTTEGGRNVPDCKAGSIEKICEEFMKRILQFRWCLTPECIKRHSSTKHFSLEVKDVTDTVVLTADNIRRNILNGRQVFHFLEESGIGISQCILLLRSEILSSGALLSRLSHKLTEIHICETRCFLYQLEYTFA